MIWILALCMIESFLYLDPSSLAVVPHGAASRLILSLFAHLDAEHLMLNLLALIPTGILFERRYGSKSLLLFSLGAGILANLCELYGAPHFNNLLGASGIVCALTATLSCISRISATLSGILLIYLLWGSTVRPDSAIAYDAHLGGFLCGLLWAVLNPWIPNAPTEALESC